MFQRFVISAVSAAMLAASAAPVAADETKPKAKPVNVTGTWNTNIAGNRSLELRQEGATGG